MHRMKCGERFEQEISALLFYSKNDDSWVFMHHFLPLTGATLHVSVWQMNIVEDRGND